MEGLAISSPSSQTRRRAAPSPSSPTPRANRAVIDLCSSSPEDTATPLGLKRASNPVSWGSPYAVNDDSDLEPSHAPLFVDSGSEDESQQSSQGHDGLSSDVDEWGQGAVLEWDGVLESGEEVEHQLESYPMASTEDDDEDEGEEIHDIDAISDGDQPSLGTTMPMFEEWDTVKLKALVKGYGFRESSDRRALIRLASECWQAANPPEPPVVAVRGKGRRKATDKGAKNNKRQLGQGTQDTASTLAPQEKIAELHAKFHSMIVNDEAFWIRILRYEPISFDELVSRAIAAGVSGTGWQPRLKRFLDLKGVTYYTSDPTAPRRRGRK